LGLQIWQIYSIYIYIGLVIVTTADMKNFGEKEAWAYPETAPSTPCYLRNG